MELVRTLSREEMKSIKAGRANDCAIGCLDFQGQCHEACIDAFEPDDDNRAYCNRMCYKQAGYCMELNLLHFGGHPV
ncbi:hypothetical protein, partial [Fodinibius halophilus]|uniref:hypothetical protein n=1 Tax=Fodinibius halophilus TaxID=1736908 RepID=UPI00197A9CBE